LRPDLASGRQAVWPCSSLPSAAITRRAAQSCPAGVDFVVTAADGSKTYAAVIGESVIWDVIVDENEVVAVNDCHVMWSDDVSSDVVVNVSGGAKIEVIALSWNNLPEEKSTPYFKVGNIVYQ